MSDNNVMKITKHGHACLEFEIDGERVLLDPGFYTEAMGSTQNVRAIVITHQHDDHCFEDQIDAITATQLAAGREAPKIYSVDEVCARLAKAAAVRGTKYDTVAVHHGDFYQDEAFSFEFFGDLHAEIHRSYPLVQNCGVMVNGQVYYPGDSYTLPDRPVEVLAVPTSAPWLKIGDVIDFVAAVKPKRSFATHNALLSDRGHALNNGRVQSTTEAVGGTFSYLLDGDSIEV
jgi:L-ascorbate metabolism protein UlaG (beta-lactamase superfamily)